MNDMAAVIAPKSNQTNADDFIAGPKTVTITAVEVRAGQEQPITVHYEGDNGKPYKPCKSMARVMVQAWGASSSEYAGKSMTLYRDPDVTWGGVKVGGIRISHMSHIKRDLALALSLNSKQRAMHIIKPLPMPKAEQAPQPDSRPAPEAEAFDQAAFVADMEAAIADAESVESLSIIWKGQKHGISRLMSADDAEFQRVKGLATQRRAELAAQNEMDEAAREAAQ